MKILLLLLIALPTYGATGDWAGYEEIETRLRSRLFENSPSCRPAPEIIAEYERLAPREVMLNPEDRARFIRLRAELTLKPGFLLAGVLGDFLPRTTSFALLMGSRFQPSPEAFWMASSHVVNALNTFAWEMTMRTLAAKLAGSCDTFTIKITDPSISIPSCRTREVPLRRELQMILMKVCAGRAASDELYDLVMGMSAPEAERSAILAQGGNPEALFTMILLNPYFLLEH